MQTNMATKDTSVRQPFTIVEIKDAIQYACACLGVKTLKSLQKEVITEFVLGNDVFVALPTGFGKSFCYGCLPFVYDRLRGQCGSSIVLVVSPLISLMTDQVSRFLKMGLSAGMLRSGGLAKDEVAKVVEGQHQLLFVSPEALESKDKRQITAVFGCTMAGDFLPPYSGKTSRCLPTMKFDDTWHVTYTSNHWANEETTLDTLTKF